MLNLEGHKYNSLTVISEASRRGNSRRWYCLCDCGNTTVVHQGCIRCGNTKSCGCLQKARGCISNKTHGGSGSRLFNIWNGMKQRCYDSNQASYKSYGGRGITVCKEWLDDFAAFEAWALSNGYSNELTLERKKNHLGYNPKNCTWATRKEQSRNRSMVKLNERSVGFIKRYLRDTSMTQHEIGALFGVNRRTISSIATGKLWADVQPIEDEE